MLIMVIWMVPRLLKCGCFPCPCLRWFVVPCPWFGLLPPFILITILGYPSGCTASPTPPLPLRISIKCGHARKVVAVITFWWWGHFDHGAWMPGSPASTPPTPTVGAGAQKRKAEDALQADTERRLRVFSRDPSWQIEIRSFTPQIRNVFTVLGVSSKYGQIRMSQIQC